MLSASWGETEQLNNIAMLPYTCIHGSYKYINWLQCVFSYAGSESVYGDVVCLRREPLTHN